MTQIIKNLLALTIAVIGVHAVYIGYIRPEAAVIVEAAKLAGQSTPRDIVVILKDYEQEICLIFMVWGVFQNNDDITRG